ncbi:MAG TPA: peptidylprolyl isomerase [Bacteroidetes bacterium]|nr:peptidylprolyl isomerase [Bacteroidota bacterium]
MKQLLLGLITLAIITTLPGCERAPAGADVKIITEYGDLYIKLYDETPKHKENFLKLAEEGFYDGTTFHRVIKDFMIQGGDPNTKEGGTGVAGQGGPGYTIPREINPKFFHKKGVLAAARQGDQVNPNWESSGSQFYLVQGKKWNDGELDQMQAQMNMMIDQHVRRMFDEEPTNAWMRTVDLEALQVSNPDSFQTVNQKMQEAYTTYRKNWPTVNFSKKVRNVYKNKGGYAPLDGMYTVFGEVVEGEELIDVIGGVPTAAGDRPVKDVRITVEVLH